ncbi:hypothetical protein [Melioribacter sp. OK-6-Me]|uniref:hypothetical protein n=1 Tax=unclassified Melioribacter TaxID=2627329 RepID=UPI003EDB67D6
MNSELINSINELTLIYKKSKDERLLQEINRLLRLLEYQSWYLKATLGIIDFRHDYYEDPEIKKYEELFSHSNAFSKFHLIIPLLMYLFKNYNNEMNVLDMSISFMKELKDFLRPGDYAKTRTGAQRFITNTRFASNELRRLGMLRSDRDHFFHSWKLSPYGVLIAGSLYIDFVSHELNKFLDYKLNKDSAYINSLNLITETANEIVEKNKFDMILRFILEEEIIYYMMRLYEDSFRQFVKLVNNFINSKYNRNAEEDLEKFLNELKYDKEISRLADSIKIRKEIDYNMKQFYSIINNVK